MSEINDKELLLELREIKNDTIYLTTVEELLLYYETLFNGKIDYGSLFKTYFPMLYKDNVVDIQSLNLRKQHLVQETNRALDKSYSNLQCISEFNDIYPNRTSNDDNPEEENLFNHGIINISFVITPLLKTDIPLNNIFGLLRTSKDCILIKNNSKNSESMFRLRIDKDKSNDLKKIPILNHSRVKSIDLSMNNSGSIAGYIEKDDEVDKYTIIYDFKDNGKIGINVKTDAPKTFAQVETIIENKINNLLYHLKQPR